MPGIVNIPAMTERGLAKRKLDNRVGGYKNQVPGQRNPEPNSMRFQLGLAYSSSGRIYAYTPLISYAFGLAAWTLKAIGVVDLTLFELGLLSLFTVGPPIVFFWFGQFVHPNSRNR